MTHSMVWIVPCLAGAIFAAAQAHAAIVSKPVEYKAGEAVLEGYLVYDDAHKAMRPGVLVVHEWWGLNDYAKGRARQLAEMGYVAFAVDMYGKGKLAKTPEEAAELAGKVRGDRTLMRQRINAALDVLKKEPSVDTKRVAAIGYCFGGTTVLELARSGADLAGVVSFHGTLDTTEPAGADAIKAKVLVLSGGDDPMAPPAAIEAFEKEMRSAHADWQVVLYGRAVHSFTNPASGNDPAKGVAYNAQADKRSWQAMKDFFTELFQGDGQANAPLPGAQKKP